MALRLAAGVSLLLACGYASAHVKWFTGWNTVLPPREPSRVFSSSQWQVLFWVAVATMATLAWVDRRLTHGEGAWVQLSERMHVKAQPKALAFLRAGVCVYWLLVTLGLPQPVYLTPELAAPQAVRFVQMAGAVLVLWRATSWIAGLCLVGLYAGAVMQYGWFHLLDYPIFLSVGAALLLPLLNRADEAVLAMKLLRWGAAITLLWGGAEKLEYPEWSFGLLEHSSVLSLGLSPELAMQVYGFGELAMAFGLLAFGIGSQVAAAMLLFVFLAAVPAFGWVDLVGHSGILVVLILLTLVRSYTVSPMVQPLQYAVSRAVMFPFMVVGLCVAYYGLHGLFVDFH